MEHLCPPQPREELRSRQETVSEDWAELLTAPVQVPLGRLLRLVPNFHKALITPVAEGSTPLPIQEGNSIQAAHLDAVAAVPVIDVRIPEITVEYKGVSIDQVLIDGGAGVNITTEATCRRMGWLDWEPAPFLVRMADQRRVRPLGLLKGVVIDVAGIQFVMSFVVLCMEDSIAEYNLLLGRPWLRQAKVRHNWEHNVMSIRRGRRKVKFPLRERKHLTAAAWPVVAETVNMAEGLDDDEETQFLRDNADLIPLCLVDVAEIVEAYL